MTEDQRSSSTFVWGVGVTTATFTIASHIAFASSVSWPLSTLDWLEGICFGMIPGLVVGSLVGAIAAVANSSLSKGIIVIGSLISALFFGIVLWNWIQMVQSC
jgi:hypothetical protein